MRGIFLNNKHPNVTWLLFFCNMKKKKGRERAEKKSFADFFRHALVMCAFFYARCAEAPVWGSHQMLCSTFHTKARRPSIRLSSSIFLRRSRRGCAFSSSTMAMIELFIEGQA